MMNKPTGYLCQFTSNVKRQAKITFKTFGRDRLTRWIVMAALPIALGFLPASLSAATYYVSTSGSDANPGTQSSPLRHVSEGATRAAAGDTVIVMDGTYDNEGQVNPNYVVSLTRSGTASQPITFMAQHRGGAILDGGLTSSTSCNGAYAYFNLGNESYIVIQGFQIRHTCEEGIHNNDSAHHITIRQNEIHHIANLPVTDTYGRVATGCPTTSHDIVIDGNSIHDIGRNNGGFTTSLDHGLYMNCSNLKITNNIFYNQVDGWDIQLSNGANNVLIANNTFASHNPGQSGQIMLWNSHNGLTIRNNIFYNAPNEAITTYTANVSGCQIDSNLISGSAGVYSGSGCTVGANKTGVDPMFVNAQAHDFELQAGSPAINTGASIAGVDTDILGTFRPQGGATDIGAYEYASGAASSGPTPSPTPTPTPTPAPAPTPAPTSSSSSDDGLVAYWGFNEGHGATVADLSGNQNTGTFVGAPAWVTGNYGTALSFNGSSYIDVNESGTLEQSNNLTVSFWILASSVSGDPRIVAKSYSWDIKLNGQSRHPQFSAGGKYAMLSDSLPTGTWQHVAFTFSSGVVKGYVNGVSQPFAQNTFTGTGTLPRENYGLLIGTDAGKQYFAKGFIDDVRIYDRTLSAADVATLYSQTQH
jgi:hypothetical protein